MLDEYKKTQPIAYKIIMNEINNNKHSHAYILEANGFHDTMGFAISMAKTLFCAHSENLEKIINLIDVHNFPELKIIDPEGLIIKKEEIEELKIDFSKKPIYSNKKIYIINNAERLNSSAANSLLKFLEEPSQDIIAILITNNVYQMIETILSRCQIISLVEEKKNCRDLQYDERISYLLDKTKSELETIFENQNISDYLCKCIDFVNYYEKHKLDTCIYINKIWFQYYKTKEAFDIAYQIMILYYTDVLRYACGSDINIFVEYENDIISLSKELSISCISKKIKVLMSLLKRVKQNNNLNLLMDKVLIEFGRCDGIV